MEYIILPTFAYEHKIFVGPFSRRFPKAKVWVAPRCDLAHIRCTGLKAIPPWFTSTLSPSWYLLVSTCGGLMPHIAVSKLSAQALPSNGTGPSGKAVRKASTSLPLVVCCPAAASGAGLSTCRHNSLASSQRASSKMTTLVSTSSVLSCPACKPSRQHPGWERGHV